MHERRQRVERIGHWILTEDAVLPILPDMALHSYGYVGEGTHRTQVSYADGRVIETRAPMSQIADAIVAGIAVSFELSASTPTEQPIS